MHSQAPTIRRGAPALRAPTHDREEAGAVPVQGRRRLYRPLWSYLLPAGLVTIVVTVATIVFLIVAGGGL